jgi:hypothetical protein
MARIACAGTGDLCQCAFGSGFDIGETALALWLDVTAAYEESRSHGPFPGCSFGYEWFCAARSGKAGLGATIRLWTM